MPTRKYKVVTASSAAGLEDKMNQLDDVGWYLFSIVSNEGWLVATFEYQEV